MKTIEQQAEELYPFPDKKDFDDWEEYAEAKTYSLISEAAHIKALTTPSIYKAANLVEFDFVVWYSGMDEEKIKAAYARYLNELPNPPKTEQ